MRRYIYSRAHVDEQGVWKRSPSMPNATQEGTTPYEVSILGGIADFGRCPNNADLEP